jgi:porin
MSPLRLQTIIAFGGLALISATPAFARGGDHTDPGHTSEGDAPPSVASSLPEPLSSAGGLREALEARGFEFGLKYIGDVFSNAGGLHSGAVYDGKLRFSVDGDFDKAFALKGLKFHANASQLHGGAIDGRFTGALMPTSNIEATPTTRLYEIWLEQSLADDTINVRAGQLGADQEFMTRDWAKIFVNNSLGWPAILISDLPSGGPAFPLSSMGLRIKAKPLDNVSLMAAIYNGDPGGPQGPFDSADPQRRNRDGLRFRLSDPPLAMSEAQIKHQAFGLPGAVKLGVWRHFGLFADQRLGVDGLSLADPSSIGVAAQRRGDHGFYGLVDQQFWKKGDDGQRGGGGFFRLGGAPNDRNLISLYAEAGLSFNGAFDARPDDSFGVTLGYARISSAARAFDRDTALFQGMPTPVRSYEGLLEATYIAQIIPGWTLQPDFQYVRNPGGNIADPRDPNGQRPLHSSVVFGLRTLIRY